MKKLILPLIAVVALVVTWGCSTKFNIAAPYKNITVIYGLLDERDAVHYIRIEKAFLSQTQSSVTMAKDADSSFYPLLDVRIKRVDFSGNYIDTIQLTRIDLDNVPGYQKQPGIFFTTPNYAYQFNNTLNPNYIYRILVTNPATGETDSANAPIIDDLNLSGNDPVTFHVDIIDDSELNRADMNFASTMPNRNYNVNILYTPLSNFSFEGLNYPEALAQVIFRFHWNDSVPGQPEVADSFDYDAGYQLIGTANTAQFVLSNLSFFSAIASGMGVAPPNTYRLMNVLEVFVYLGTQDYNSYYQNSLTTGVGLTGNEIEPVYTNIQGANALGLFTSRGYRSSLLTISPATIDSLEQSPVTQNVKIAGTTY